VKRALWGYEGKTNKLKTLGVGTGGIENWSESITDSKVFFGYLRYIRLFFLDEAISSEEVFL